MYKNTKSCEKIVFILLQNKENWDKCRCPKIEVFMQVIK